MSELEIVLEYLPITLRKEIISNIGTEENKIERNTINEAINDYV